MPYYVPGNDYLCPWCNTLNGLDPAHLTVTESPLLNLSANDGRYVVRAQIVVCRKCKEPSLRAGVKRAMPTTNPGAAAQRQEGMFSLATSESVWDEQIRPASSAKSFPDVPKDVHKDYYEAALIADRSPRAAAILARRAVEGVLADSFEIRDGSLAKRLRDPSLTTRLGAELVKGLAGIRVLGNDAAHAGNDEPDDDLLDRSISSEDISDVLRGIEILFDRVYVQQRRDAEAIAQLKALAERERS